jgi:SAM-dependent methyltransferase
VSAEYANDVPYVRHFVGELSPARLRLAAALNGVSPPPALDFDYCELGCAHGDTLAALAAAYPEARFLGVDLSAAHVASAKRLARDGALENIGILERDFSALAHEDIGTFDYVVAHGVLSWVSPEKRRALLQLASARLKPGGLLYVSYNAMPGWASVEPLRQLLLFGGAHGAPRAAGAPDAPDAPGAGDTSLERARRALEFARSMESAGAEYFAKNPAASEMLTTMTRAGLPYVVHEYLHEHWAPMYFARVAWEMAEHDLHFAGALPAHQNFRETALSEAQERLLEPVTDRVTFESLKDFAIHEFFRRDLFVKGSVPRSKGAMNAYLDSTAWGTLAKELPPERTVRLPHRAVSLDNRRSMVWL